MVNDPIGTAMWAATEEMPASRVIDLDRVADEGRRRIRRRRVATAVTSGLVVAALAVGVAAADVRDRSGTLGGDPGPAAARTGPAVAAAAPARFDPLRLRLRPGWVPDDLPERVQQTSVTSQHLRFIRYGAADQGAPEASLTVSVYAAGATPDELEPYPGGAAVTPTPAPSVGGRPAQWFDRAGRRSAVLVWSWAPDAQAVVTVAGGTSQEGRRETALRFAGSLRTDADEPVRIPFTVPAPPAPLRLVGSMVAWRGPDNHAEEFSAHLEFSDRDDSTDPDTKIPRLLYVSVQSVPDAQGDPKSGYPNTRIAGHPALVEFDADGGRVGLYDEVGHRLTVSVYDPVTATYVDKGRAVALVTAIEMVAVPADPTRWSTGPVR